MSKAERIAAEIKEAANRAWDGELSRDDHWTLARRLWDKAEAEGVLEEVRKLCTPR